MEMENVLFAFGRPSSPGLSAGVVSAPAFFTKKTDTRFPAFSLGAEIRGTSRLPPRAHRRHDDHGRQPAAFYLTKGGTAP
jgi:hypothetical protein